MENYCFTPMCMTEFAKQKKKRKEQLDPIQFWL